MKWLPLLIKYAPEHTEADRAELGALLERQLISLARLDPGFKDPQELLGLQAGLMAPVGEMVLSYHRQLREIAVATQAACAKVTEAEYESHNRRCGRLSTALRPAHQPVRKPR